MKSFVAFHGISSIMTTIQTAVDGGYIVDGENGELRSDGVLLLHLLNPNKRQVTQADIDAA